MKTPLYIGKSEVWFKLHLLILKNKHILKVHVQFTMTGFENKRDAYMNHLLWGFTWVYIVLLITYSFLQAPTVYVWRVYIHTAHITHGSTRNECCVLWHAVPHSGCSVHRHSLYKDSSGSTKVDQISKSMCDYFTS